MRTESEILCRINEIKNKLEKLNCKKSDEFQKNILEKDYRLLLFLHFEIKTYTSALTQLEWMIK
jgi:hypothetical protein